MADEPNAGTPPAPNPDADADAGADPMNVDPPAGAGTGSAGKGNGATPPAAPESEGAWWEQHVQGDELRKVASRYASPTDMARAVSDARRQLSQRVALPTADASDEDREKFWRAVGIPESPDGYKYTYPEGMPEELQPDEAAKALEQDFVAKLHKAHAPPEAVQAAIEWYYSTATEMIAQQKKQDTEFAEAAEATLRKEWGGDFDRNQTAANRFLQQFGGDDVEALRQLEASDGRFLLDHPLTLRLFANAGLALSEDQPGVQTLPAERQQSINARIEELQRSADYWQSDSKQKEVAALFEQLYGNEPVRSSGTGGVSPGGG